MKEEKIFSEKLKAFLHDPIDKCLDIKDHENRARRYAEKLGISNIEEASGPDHIASCMERSLLPKVKVYQDFNEIRHPLSEKEIKISLSENDKEEIFEIIESVFKSISEKVSFRDDKQKFLYLWRNLQEELVEKSKGKFWQKYLSVLPADTRIPDHSIWEHLKISSAINAWLDKETDYLIQNNSLFLFTIGPVQSFISQARKTQDFYMGSFILSFLTFKAMELVIDKYGPTNIIYPDLYKQPLMDWWMKKNLNLTPKGYKESDLQLPTIPNRFVALIPTTNYEEIKGLADEMTNKIKKTIFSAKNIIFKELKINEKLTDEIDKKIDSQLSEFPEIYWVALSWKIKDRDISHDDLRVFFEEKIVEQYKKLWDFANEFIEINGKKEPKNVEYFPNVGLLYELLYSALEKSMGARKNIRIFKQYKEEGRKCSVCGERDVIFFSESKNERKFTSYNTKAVDLTRFIDLKFLTDGEGLCATCFLKRTFEVYLKKEVSENAFDKLTFPSTAEVACTDWKQNVRKNLEHEFKKYVEKLKKILKENFLKVSPLPKLKEEFKNLENPDGQFFYEENITKKYFEKELGLQVGEDEINELKKALKELYKEKNKPKSYYAIIHLDVDNMGKWLSGELLPDIEYAYNSETWIKMPDSFKNEIKKHLLHKPLTPAIHASISTALRNYALEFVRKIVEEEHLGKLVYAGGDDVLAFVNLKDLFDVMNKLRWAFSGNIKIENGRIKVDTKEDKSSEGYEFLVLNESNGFVEKDEKFILTMGPKATASAGVVIAHYKAPLQIVIKKVFEMEKKAKDSSKNAFAICLMKRSGEEREIVAKWSYDENNKKINTIELVKELVNVFDENNGEGFIAKSFIQKMDNELIRLKDEEGKFFGTAAIFDVELKRLLDRSYNGSKEKKKDFIERNYQIMKKLFWETGGNIDNFLNICRIATFISKAED